MSGAAEGFRLERLEILNWGTFDKRVWVFEPGCQDALLTGDIGSGKSTLVDALCTLLLPPQKVAYNKAAGADKRERDLRSYVLGYHRRQMSEETGAARPVVLRQIGAYSVILGVFANPALNTRVSLATVFWFATDHAGQPDRFYCLADRGLSITEDFSGFGTDMNDLKKRLRRAEGCEVLPNYPPYGTKLRRRLGIASEQALELFHQTVSMKAVGSLDEFVREHMLEPFDTSGIVKDIIAHFDDLDQAHKAVIRAEEQIGRLKPLLRHCDRYDEHVQAIADATAQQEALRPYIASLRVAVLDAEQKRAVQDKGGAESALGEVAETIRRLKADQRDTEQQRAEAGGRELSMLESKIGDLEMRRDKRRERHEEFAAKLRQVELGPVAGREQFSDRLREIKEAREAVNTSIAEADDQWAGIRSAQDKARAEAEEIDIELRGLHDRASNVPAKLLAVRTALARACDVDDGALPFAGELIQVKESETAWRPAAERLLHSFATSILVPGDLYPKVSEWIDANDLRTSLTYYRVPDSPPQRREASRRNLPLMVDKLELKRSEFYEWLEAELQHRAGHECCENLADFRASAKAITRNGQVKTPGGRHTKNDTRNLDDRTSWVLGWDAREKINALRTEATRVQQRIDSLRAQERRSTQKRRRLGERKSILDKLEETRDFAEIDHWGCALEIQGHQERLAKLKSGSGRLEVLTRRLEELEGELKAADGRKTTLERKHAVAENDAKRAEDELTHERTRAAALESVPEETVAAVKRLLADTVPDADFAALDGCAQAQSDAEEHLRKAITTSRARQESAATSAARTMQDFLNTWPEFGQEMDADIGARGEYRRVAEQLINDDLPRYKDEFREYLRTNTIRDIATFASQLHRHADEIGDRIAVINESLKPVEFNPGRYIQLEARKTQHAEVREFQQQLRDCTEDALSDDDHYTEQKFHQVTQILERLRGREGFTGVDKAWRERVTDVRNWYTFLARERDRDTGAEHESYSDSDGKSGGQKEKLAYTILAASLAYQYKLDGGAAARKQFRFVMIDEAFGRGSEDSSRFGMELFTSLGLQLLVVTPLEKIEVIASYVAAVGFVDNPGGNYSRLQNLTIDEYREGRVGARGQRVDH